MFSYWQVFPEVQNRNTASSSFLCLVFRINTSELNFLLIQGLTLNKKKIHKEVPVNSICIKMITSSGNADAKKFLICLFPRILGRTDSFLYQTYYLFWHFKFEFGRSFSAVLKLPTEWWVLFFAVQVKTGMILLLTTEAVWQEKTWCPI